MTSHSAVEKRFFGPPFFAQAKKGVLARRRRAKALDLDPALDLDCDCSESRIRSKSFHSPSGSELLFFACAKK
ncbi:MAG: hypothetical protein ACN6RK_11675, partial [Stenotrophomonas sp.]